MHLQVGLKYSQRSPFSKPRSQATPITFCETPTGIRTILFRPCATNRTQRAVFWSARQQLLHWPVLCWCTAPAHPSASAGHQCTSGQLCCSPLSWRHRFPSPSELQNNTHTLQVTLWHLFCPHAVTHLKAHQLGPPQGISCLSPCWLPFAKRSFIFLRSARSFASFSKAARKPSWRQEESWWHFCYEKLIKKNLLY